MINLWERNFCKSSIQRTFVIRLKGFCFFCLRMIVLWNYTYASAIPQSCPGLFVRRHKAIREWCTQKQILCIKIVNDGKVAKPRTNIDDVQTETHESSLKTHIDDMYHRGNCATTSHLPQHRRAICWQLTAYRALSVSAYADKLLRSSQHDLLVNKYH